MKPIIALVFALLSVGLFAQPLPVAVMVDSLSTNLTRLKEQSKWIEDTAHAVQQIQEAVKTANDVNSALQYQIQAAKALEAGSWDGFVEAYSYETAAVSQVNSAVSDLTAFDDENIQKMLKDPNYASFAQRLKMLDTYMQRSNAVVRSTDNLAKNAVRNLQANQKIVDKSSQTKSTLSSLQLQSQQLGLLASTLADVQQTLAAAAMLNESERNSNQILLNQQKEAIKNFMTSGGGKGIYDQSDPDAHWNTVVAADWTQGDN